MSPDQIEKLQQPVQEISGEAMLVANICALLTEYIEMEPGRARQWLNELLALSAHDRDMLHIYLAWQTGDPAKLKNSARSLLRANHNNRQNTHQILSRKIDRLKKSFPCLSKAFCDIEGIIYPTGDKNAAEERTDPPTGQGISYSNARRGGS